MKKMAMGTSQPAKLHAQSGIRSEPHLDAQEVVAGGAQRALRLRQRRPVLQRQLPSRRGEAGSEGPAVQVQSSALAMLAPATAALMAPRRQVNRLDSIDQRSCSHRPLPSAPPHPPAAPIAP